VLLQAPASLRGAGRAGPRAGDPPLAAAIFGAAPGFAGPPGWPSSQGRSRAPCDAAQSFHLLTSARPGWSLRFHSSAQAVHRKGATEMADKGSKDKGKKETKKKAQHTTKEKRKLKQEKKKQ
jgi:hypothetical protein